ELTAMGYERVDRVDAPGQFSVRGGIVDVFPVVETSGIRIELFDDEVDSIRRFDPEDQRSHERIEEAVIGPAREFLILPDRLPAALEALRRATERQVERLRALGLEEEARHLSE